MGFKQTKEGTTLVMKITANSNLFQRRKGHADETKIFHDSGETISSPVMRRKKGRGKTCAYILCWDLTKKKKV